MVETSKGREGAAVRPKDGLRSRDGRIRRVLVGFLVGLLLAGSAAGAPQALAQTRPIGGRSYLNPFPQSDRYQIYVIGDSLAEGLAQGLEDAFQKETSVKVINYTRPSSGLARQDVFDWTAEMGRLAQSQPVHAAVILMGVNDQRPVRTEGAAQKWGTPAWTDAYGRNVERLIKKLKAADVAIYWIGLPIMGKTAINEAVDAINTIVREKCYLNGVKYIESASGFTDQFGAYTVYGADLAGQQKRLRDADGVHFTTAGYRKLASYVDVVIRRDLAAARSERNIPLAGDEDEQAKITPLPAAGAGAQADGRGSGDNPRSSSVEKSVAGEKSAAGARPAAPDGKTARARNDEAPPQQGARADGSGSPARPDAQLTHGQNPVLHSEGGAFETSGGAGAAAAAPQQGAPQGEMIAGDIRSGVTTLATASSFYDMSLKVAQRRIPLGERTYYKVLVKGEALKAKAGRTDDFKWPRG